MHFTLRRATAYDADAIANVYSASFRLLTFLPMLHTVEGYRWFIANVILNDCEVTVAEDKSGIVAFLASASYILAPIGSHGCGHAVNRCSKGHRDRHTRTVVLPSE
jgi:hypothetical protein